MDGQLSLIKFFLVNMLKGDGFDFQIKKQDHIFWKINPIQILSGSICLRFFDQRSHQKNKHNKKKIHDVSFTPNLQ